MASKKDPNNHIIIEKIPSDSDPSVFYKIGVDKKLSEKFGHVHFTCSCTAFKFSGKSGIERDCKHAANFAINCKLSKLFLAPIHGILINANLETIVGWKLKNSENGIFSLDKKLYEETNIPQTIGIFLTEIICPYIMCSHVMKGNFSL